MQKITKEQEQEIIKLYATGINCKEVAKIINCHFSLIVKILKKNNIKIRHGSSYGALYEHKCSICEKKINGSKYCKTCRTKIRRYQIKKFLVNYKGGKCEICGYIENIGALDFHHIDVNNKEFMISKIWKTTLSKTDILKEINKCMLLCSNCHKSEHNDYNNKIVIKEVDDYLKNIRPLKNKMLITNCSICNKPTSKHRHCGTCEIKFRKHAYKKNAVSYLGGKCKCCGWSGNMAAFEFHHINPNTKKTNLSAVILVHMSKEKASKELDKCELLCSNCHRGKHNDYNNPKIIEAANGCYSTVFDILRIND